MYYGCAALRSTAILISNSYYREGGLSWISRVWPTIGREVVKAVCENSLWVDGRSCGKKMKPQRITEAWRGLNRDGLDWEVDVINCTFGLMGIRNLYQY
ncbi:hypothetical protein CDAR_522461 [Caerostris darwini]|uniref:Uncharacterized protein n=1 Tax=Caerostris darwini TaxID=1538125 RepID=A0AAV4VQY7_9ARAC|nr:hypothetical protein CDAR_522461 [Caerostris darwini]